MLRKLTFVTILSVSILFSGCSKKDIVNILDDVGIPTANNKAVGASAKELLTAGIYTSLVIEIQYMPGYAPEGAAITNLTNFLDGLLNKPGGIHVTQTQIPASGKSSLTVNEIANLEKVHRTAYTAAGKVALYLLITDAQYSEPNVLGLAYRNTSIALMGKTIYENSGGIGQTSRTKLVTTVLEHELGHALGLVNLGTPMTVSHQDANHANHCNNANCLMYYSSNTTDLLGILLVGNIPQLDANCVNHEC